jgi:hypothetical protein
MNDRKQAGRGSEDEEQDEGSNSEAKSGPGYAIHDPAQQSRRQDMPEEEQSTAGQEMRGSAPSHEPDHSNQPHREDHRSNQDWGAAAQSGKRQGG